MYSAAIDRKNPGCFLFVLDQSQSMQYQIAGADTSKAQGLAEAINLLLQNLALRCTDEDGVRDYFDVGVIGYGGHRNGPVLDGRLSGRALVALSELADNPARVELRERIDDAGRVTRFRRPIWFDAVAVDGTPMKAALEQARSIVEPWVGSHPGSYPPVVIHLADGEAKDGDPVPAAHNLRELSTRDGNVLLFNCHISSHSADAFLFPGTPDDLPDNYGRMLFEMSSVLPPTMLQAARDEGLALHDRARGMALNANLTHIIRFLDIGTRTTGLAR